MKIRSFFLACVICISFSYSQDEKFDFAIALYLSSELEYRINENEEKGLNLRDSSFEVVKKMSQENRLNFYLMSYYFSKMLDGVYLGEWGNEISCNGDFDDLKKKVDVLLMKSLNKVDKDVLLRLKSFLDHRKGKCLTKEEMSL